jgi:sigma-B regulation protein RsbU (phosphoserine phosphatase)
MNESSNTLETADASGPFPGDIAAARAEIARLNAELDDLKLLYDAMLEHGEAVEDQLADKNLELERTQARLAAELADATRYVFSILPAPRPDGPATDHLLVPSTELGGDSFGYHDIDDDHFAVYLLDVCGHGVGAALLSVSVINLLRAGAISRTDFRDPASVLKGLNAIFPMERQNNMFFTIWYGVFQRSSGRLCFATGGHPPALLRRGDGSMEELITTGNLVIGAFEGVDYEQGETTVMQGDRLFLLSDGTFELDTGDGDMLSVEALKALLAPGGAGPKEVLEWARRHHGGETLPDDFSLLEVRF